MRTSILVCLFSITSAAVAVPMLHPAGNPLPPQLKATWAEAGFSAFIWYPITNPANVDQLSARVWFQTEARLVDFGWLANAPGAKPAELDESHSVSYEPTAMCCKAGRSPTVFIAGYAQRTGNVIIEQWDCDDILIGSGAAQGGGQPKTTFSKTIHKSAILQSSTVKPLKAILYNRYDQRLWLFEEESPWVVWRLDPDAETPIPEALTDGIAVPAIAAAKSAQTTLVKPSAPDGGGFLIMLYPWRAWKPDWALSGNLKQSDQLFIMRDIDLNGSIDESATLTWNQLKDVRLYMLNEDAKYP